MNSLKVKFLVTAIVPLFITIILLVVINIYNLVSDNDKMLGSYEAHLIDEKKALIKNQMKTVGAVAISIYKSNDDKVKAKALIIDTLSSVRYLKNKSGYFFAYEQKGSDYYFAFHGVKNHLNGKKTDINKPDIKGFTFRKALIENGSKDKFVQYHYKKPNTDKLLKKMAYSTYIPELNWTLVTGIYMDDINSEVDKIAKVNSDNLSFTIKGMIVVSLVLILLSIVITTLVINKVFVTPIKNFEKGIVSFFDYINKETNQIEQLDQSSKDELGHMSKLVNENILKTKKYIDEDRKIIDETITVLTEFAKGDLCQRITMSVSNNELMQLKDILNKMGTNMEQNINAILNVLEKYSKYDYLDKVDTNNLKDHLLKLANGVNELGSSITNTLIKDRENGQTLGDSSNVLLDNVDGLSKNSNEAAASLEETSAALEEITNNISNNTNNIVKMAGYANNVTTSVKKGQGLATQTTQAMDQINEEVSAINEAISVIDQISFQTNILSLNAAVEAATAGEAGKGFAVVAQEVRNLASRSAEAANEIKNLVENATVKANNGKQIADEMIDGYTDLNNSISSTLELIVDVETASKEQQSGIVQINDAVNILDKQTQQNASIASQTKQIAVQTDDIAKIIIQNTDEKNFHGKK
ncbi:MAG: methyl-accepting chemotaxis protein [Campylobacterota bacterium]|nr:methyl-accepting chemotaxis protein [Campylobacterota bacterium]